MIVAYSKKKIRAEMRRWKDRGLSVGFVPTMGFFHKGHLSLMEKSMSKADKTIVSIFVNPTQFGPGEDYNRYPRDLKRDLELAEAQGVDAVFVPDVREVYPEPLKTWVYVEGLSRNMCGRSRPGHFKGVCTVVAKLFNIIQPDVAVFGQKDFQQLQIIRQMVKDLDFPVEIVAVPTYREQDGLAMSSRNSYLSDNERKSSLCLFKALEKAKELVFQKRVNNAQELCQILQKFILDHPFTRIDYVFVGDPETLEPVSTIKKPLIIALAVYVGKTRLIDNILLT